jgi:hypothetical protein
MPIGAIFGDSTIRGNHWRCAVRIPRRITHGNLPVTRVLRQDLPNSLTRHFAASMFSRHEELSHVVLNPFAALGEGVDQGEADQPFFDADQQRLEALDAPIMVNVRKWRIAACGAT